MIVQAMLVVFRNLSDSAVSDTVCSHNFDALMDNMVTVTGLAHL